MCNFASFILTEHDVFWSDTSDSHEDIIREHSLVADRTGSVTILRVEIRPSKTKTVDFSDYDSWDYEVDQDVTPLWHDPVVSEQRTRAALAKRARKGFTTVRATGCTALTRIIAPKATTVRATGCPALTRIIAPKATYVDATGCTALTRLIAPKAIYVYAAGCKSLTRIIAPKAIYVYADGCNSLKGRK